MKQDAGAIKSLKNLHTSLVMGLFLFAVSTLFVAGAEPFRIENETFDRIVQVIASVFSIAAIILGFNIFKKSLIRIRKRNVPGIQRMDQYRKACIIWWAVIIAPAFFAALCYAATDKLSFFFLSCLHILILFLFRPNTDNIILLLNLNSDDISQLQKRL